MDIEIIRRIMNLANLKALNVGVIKIYPEHLLWGILQSNQTKVNDLLTRLDVNKSKFLDEVEDVIRKKRYKKSSVTAEELANVDKPEFLFTTTTFKILKNAKIEAQELDDDKLSPEHLLLAMLKDKSTVTYKLLEKWGVDYETMKDVLSLDKLNGHSMGDNFKDNFQNLMKDMLNNFGGFENPNSQDDDERGDGNGIDNSTHNSKGLSLLEKFGKDLTEMALQKKLDPVLGREREIQRIAQILSRRKKNNPILVGDAGVGKSAIVEGLAMRIVAKEVPFTLLDKRIVSLDIASLVAGTKYRGQFEERIKQLVDEISNDEDVILFMDEIHTIVGAGGTSNGLDAANILKPALARGEFQCIGATTLDEYRETIEKDAALERRFQKIIIEPSTVEETLEILRKIAPYYESFHNVKYSDDALKACVKLSVRYLSERSLPDKAIDVLDDAGSRIHIGKVSIPDSIKSLEARMDDVKEKKNEAAKAQNFELAASYRDEERTLLVALNSEMEIWEKNQEAKPLPVTEENVADVISLMSGIPVKRIAKSESAKLRNMAKDLSSKVIGQSEAINNIVKAIQRSRVGLKDLKRPIGSFMFLGSTGVGKTQLAKVLANYLFDSEDALIRIDMSEYMEKFSVSRLVGAPPGYVGYEEGGQLTEKVRRKPYSVILLDEIEKAHHDVFNLLLQVLDDGQLTDSLGRKVDFKNTIIIMTSNIGSRKIEDFSRGIGFGSKDMNENREYTKSIVTKALKHTFAPEFINRLDDVIIFNPLSKEDIAKIVNIEMGELNKRVKELGFTFDLTENAKNFICKKGYDPQYGARPLKRAIQKYIADLLSEYIINKGLGTKDYFHLDYKKGKEELSIES